ncbi:MAG TPA: hypothetical protein VF923_01215 [Gemmatimonadales bacterium]
MDAYLFCLILGAAGLALMAVTGLSRHGHHAHPGHSHGHAAGRGHAHAQGAAAHGARAGGGSLRSSLGSLLWSLTSPRVLFSLLVGFGATGVLLRPILITPVAAGLAVLGGIAFERVLVTPFWNLLLKFASEPALTLESAVQEEVTAVMAFDRDGQGLIAVELDGQVVQVLGRLRPEDRGTAVRAGDRLIVEEVDPQRNRCVVSFVGHALPQS